MNKLRRFLPIVLLILVLAFYLYPSGDSAVTPSAPSVAASTEAQNLAASSPKASAKPDPAPAKPKADAQKPSANSASDTEEEELLPEDGSYTTKEDVALYLHQYGHLPSNFITKKEARAAGWPGGSLEEYFPGMCIGGDYFGNYEGKLPKAKGRTWTECDINTLGKRSRGAERIIFSNDGLIYYTDDHYESYTQLY